MTDDVTAGVCFAVVTGPPWEYTGCQAMKIAAVLSMLHRDLLVSEQGLMHSAAGRCHNTDPVFLGRAPVLHEPH